MADMTQIAEYPQILEDLVNDLEYRPHWRFDLSDVDRGQGSIGLTFTVTTRGYDTYNVEKGEYYGVRHMFPVPPAAYNEQSWRRWLFNCLLQVETHEAAEFFQIRGERPYAPHHGPGNDPYIIFDHGSDLDARTRSDGSVADA